MTPERWQQIDKLLERALEREPGERLAFLDEACAGDEELRREIETLLVHEHGGSFLSSPVLELAAKMITQENPESLVGQRIGVYQILSLLGVGGMGVVYQARDTRLKRLVAIKVLPPDKVADPERKRRFIQEARAASALNHPHIITVYDIGSESGTDFLVMEYIEGKTLDRRIPRKGMKVNEALKLAIQMADALAKAHSAGIIHRDLKPTNVMVTEDGMVKVLDFGLAKLTDVERSVEEETRTRQVETEEGMIVGTASYMSPEQAEGKKVDARSDIFSFGSVLYEMVSGQKAFEGDSKLSTLAAILNKNPKPVTDVNPTLPRELDRIISHCLRKNPARRFQDMVDLKVDLEELKEESESGKLTGPSASSLASRSPAIQATPLNRQFWGWVGAAIVVAAIAATVWLFRWTASEPVPARQLVPLTSYAGSEECPSFSPDGNQVAFSWNGEKQDNFDVYIKQIGSPNYVRLTTDPAKDVSPAYSPDGRSIGFVRLTQGRASFFVVPAIGGPERNVVDVAISPNSVYVPRPVFSWLPQGEWVVTDGLALLSTETGEMNSLTSPRMKSPPDFSPSVSPDGHTVAFYRRTGYATSDIYLLDLTGDLKPKAEPRRLTSVKGYRFGLAWTPDGREIIFASGIFAGTGLTSLWKAPTSGAGEPQQLLFNTGEADSPALSWSGNRLAYRREVLDNNIWRLSLSGPGVASGPPVQLIASTRIDSTAQYSPDGKRIAFESTRNGPKGVWVSDADGSHIEELFSKTLSTCGTPRWSPDGQRIAFDFGAEGNIDIYVIRASGGKPIPLATDPAYDAAPSWSRDGKWVYFTSNRTGQIEVWKVSAGGGKAVQVTWNGGATPFESPDGKWIYYTRGDYSGSLWKMPVNGGKENQVLPSVVSRAFSLVNEGIYFIPQPGADKKPSIQFLSFATGKVKSVASLSRPQSEGLSVTPDGRSLLYSQNDEAGSDLMLVENFR